MTKETKVLMVLLFVSWENIAFPQQLSHQVLVPAAGLAVSGTLNYSQTVGETAIEIISSAGFVFTQGFQQPGIKFSPVEIPPGTGIEVYPNPVMTDLTVKLFGETSRKISIEIINLTGTTVISETISFPDNYFLEREIPVGGLFKGIYFVRITSSDKLIRRTFKIQKI
jgi:hypothetical protein